MNTMSFVAIELILDLGFGVPGLELMCPGGWSYVMMFLTGFGKGE